MRSFLFAILLATTLPVISNAQCDTVRLAPDSLQWVIGKKTFSFPYVRAIAKYNDTLYVGGDFGYVGRYYGEFFGVDTATGQVPDILPFSKETNGTIRLCIPDGSGGMFVGGLFNKIGGVDRENLAHINSSGQVTSLSFDFSYTGTIGDQGILDMLVHNGILYIAGGFSKLNNSTRYYVAAINISTGALTSWAPGIGGKVYDIATDGTNMYVAGDFGSINTNTSRPKLAAISLSTGNLVTSWNAGMTSSTEVLSMVIDNNAMYICGIFSGYLKKLNLSDGSTISGWTPSPNSLVTKIAVSGNKLYTAGVFSTIGGQTRGRIAAIDTGTAAATNWNPGIGSSGAITSFSFYGGRLYVTGTFTTVAGQARTSVAALDTAANSTFGLNLLLSPSAYIYSVYPYGNKILLCGNYKTINPVVRDNFLAINLKSNQLLPWTFTTDGDIRNMKADNNFLYVGGNFDSLGGQKRNGLAKINLATKSIEALNIPGSNAEVETVQVNASHIYIGGRFNTPVNGTHYGVFRIDKSTDTIDAWAPTMYNGSNARVYDMAFDANYAYIAGEVYGPASTKCLLMKTNLTTASSTYLSGSVTPSSAKGYAVHLFGNRVYLGGDYTKVAGADRQSMASFDTSNLAISSFIPFPLGNTVLEIASYKNRLLAVGGSWLKVGGPYPLGLSGIGVLDTTGAGDFTRGWNPRFGGVNDVLLSGDTVFAVGDFDEVRDKGIAGLAIFHLKDNSPTLTISTATTTPCAATSVTITSSGSGVSFYKWYKNGVLISGATSSSYSFTPAAGDSMVCVGTGATTGCFIGSLVTSNSIVFGTPVTPTTPTATLSTNPLGTVCANTSVTYTCATNVTGASYQWKVGSTNFGTNSNIFTYTPVNGTIVSCVVTKPSNGCYSPSSVISDTNTASVTSNTTPTASISANPSGTQCAGTSVTYTCATNVTGGTYQWKIGSTNVGTNSNTYTYTPSNGDQVKCEVTKAAGTCFSPSSDMSNTITASVTANTTPTATLSANPSGTVCAGTSVTYTCATNISGGSYQWKVGSTNVGTNSSTYAYAPTNGDLVSCVVTKATGTCFSPSNVISDTVTASVTANTTPTSTLSANPSGAVCAGTSVTYTCATNITGGSYQWKVGSTNVGTNSSTYAYAPTNGDLVSCVVTKATGTCFSPSNVISDTVTASVTANTTPTASISANPSGAVCAGTSVTYTCATNVTGGSYQWKVGGTNVGTNSSTYAYTPINGDAITCEVTKTSGTCYSPSDVTSNSITAAVTANTTPAISIAGTATICQGSADTFVASTNVTGGNYQWKVNGANAGSNNDTFINTPANNDIITCVITPTTGCYSPATATSSGMTITVTTKTIPTISISAHPIVTEGSPVTVNATVNNVGSSYNIDWFNNAVFISTTTIPAVTYTKPAGTDKITAVIKPIGCYDSATSNILHLWTLGVGSVFSEHGISVYPNPFKNLVNARGLKQGDMVTIYNAVGAKVHETWIIDKEIPEYSFSIQELASGIYILEIRDKNNLTKGSMRLTKQ